MGILETINGHSDLVSLSNAQREVLCEEIRAFLIENLSRTGGHVASNLGVVELTVAIETVFDTARDRLVFDVGHQSYVHKLLTGRREAFSGLRQFGGIAGFPKPNESECDAFTAGHASSSVSIALGMARARTLQNADYNVIALIGDGSVTGGLAFEGFNDAAVSNEPMIVILNDNELSIDKNVGGLARHFSRLRTKERYLGFKKKYRTFMNRTAPGRAIYRVTHKVKNTLHRMILPTTIFENMGFVYMGPVDGHDLPRLITLLKTARDMRRPVVLHVVTQKGRGYAPSEEHPKLFHGIGKFDKESGAPLKKSEESFSDAFGQTMLALAHDDARVCAVTAAMPGGTGLLDFKKTYPDRLFDVGIAEGHAVSMAGGLAKQGLVPVVAIYSTFLQRAYDMILQDICLQKLHVVLAVDRAGLVGEDGETHHGVFDVGYLRHAPGLKVLAPASKQELREMLKWAVSDQSGPIAIRYPRGGDRDYTASAWKPCDEGVYALEKEGSDAVLITYGVAVHQAMQACEHLEKQGISVMLIRLLTLKPIPLSEIINIIPAELPVIVVEEAMSHCGIGEEIAAKMKKNPVYIRDLGSEYVPHGDVDSLYRYCGFNAESLATYVQGVMQIEK